MMRLPRRAHARGFYLCSGGKRSAPTGNEISARIWIRTNRPAYIPVVSRHHSYPHPFHLTTLRRSRERKACVAVPKLPLGSFLPLLCRVASQYLGYHADTHAGDSDIIFASKDQPRPSGKRVIPERIRTSSLCYKRWRIFSKRANCVFARYFYSAREHEIAKKKGKSSAQNRVNQIVAFNKILLFHSVLQRKTWINKQLKSNAAFINVCNYNACNLYHDW